MHSRKFNPNPKFLGTAEAYFVCHIGPIFQIIFDLCLHWVSVVNDATHSPSLKWRQCSVCVWVILQAMTNKRSLIMEWKTEKRNPLVTTALQKDFPTRVLRSYTHLGAKSLTKTLFNTNKHSHSCSFRANLVSFRTFRCPLFPKPVFWFLPFHTSRRL